MADDDINTVLDFIVRFQAAGREVSASLRAAYLNLHVNSLPRRTSQARRAKAKHFAQVASEVVLRNVDRQIAEYSRRATGQDLFAQEGSDPDGRKVLLNMLVRDGIDTMGNRSGDDLTRAIRNEMTNKGIERASTPDVQLYTAYRVAIVDTALNIIKSMQAQPA